MARPMYRLTAAHFLANSIYADAGTTVGSVAEGADNEWPEGEPPTMAMEPLNDEARTATAAQGRLANPIEDLPLTLAREQSVASKDDLKVAKVEDSKASETDGNAQIDKKLAGKK